MEPSFPVELHSKVTKQHTYSSHEEKSITKKDSEADVKRRSRQSFEIQHSISQVDNSDTNIDTPDKRSHPEDDDTDKEEGGGKRHESDGKISRKLGRMPITSDPTTKRKAQNRAAQRAFRERKERHLKDLEAKVKDLKMAFDSANHENSILRTQLEKISAELQEYQEKFPPPRNCSNHFPSINTQSVVLPASGLKCYNIRNPEDDKFNFDFSSLGHPPKHPVDTINSRLSDITNSLTPNYYDQISTHNQPFSYAVAKESQENFVLADNQICVTGSPSNPVPFNSQNSGGHNNSLFDLFPNDGGLNKIETKILDNLSSSNDFMNDNVGDGRSLSFSPLSYPTEQTASLILSSNPIIQSRVYRKPSTHGVKITGDRPTSLYSGAPSTHFKELESDAEKNSNRSALESSPKPELQVNLKNLKQFPHCIDSINWIEEQNSHQIDQRLVADYHKQQGIRLPNYAVNSNNNIDASSIPVPADISSAAPDDQFFKNDTTTPINDRQDEERNLEEKMERNESRTYKSNCNIVLKFSDINKGDIDLENLCSELRNKAKCSESCRKI